jgi:hypothetical protein
MVAVAPGILLEHACRSIVKGLTSKTDRVLSKTSQARILADYLRPGLEGFINLLNGHLIQSLLPWLARWDS